MSTPKAPLGVLLLHGWNSSAENYRHLAPRLEALGLPFRAPTYAGHGGADGEALRGVRWQAWLRDAAGALADLLDDADRVVIVGHSMGGWLALHLALDHRAHVDAVIVAGASLRTVSLLGPGRPLHFLAPWLPRLLKSVRRRAPAGGSDAHSRPGYARVPTDSVLELFSLIRATQARLAGVDVPLLVLHSRRDTTNAPAGAPRLLHGVATPPRPKTAALVPANRPPDVPGPRAGGPGSHGAGLSPGAAQPPRGGFAVLRRPARPAGAVDLRSHRCGPGPRPQAVGMIRSVLLPDQTTVPALGQGTWRMGEDSSLRQQEISALRAGVEQGLTLIDTAEMYGEGATETLLGEALVGLRDRVFLVSKVYPQNAGSQRLGRACEASLRRLKTDHLDLYLLHWRGAVPLAETVGGMERLVAAGKIRRWGVSNLDADDMRELERAGGERCATDQVLYNVTARGAEFDLLPQLARSGVPVMAYSPVGQGRLPPSPGLARVAQAHGVSPFQVALAWVLRDPNVIAIPKAATLSHLAENLRAASLALGPEDLAAIDRDFPAPTRRSRLAML